MKYLFSIFLIFSPYCLSAQTGTLDQRVAKLERLLENQALLDLLEQLDVLEKQVRNLQGEIDTRDFELVNQKEQLAEFLQNIERRLQSLEGGGQRKAEKQAVPEEAPVDKLITRQIGENNEITSDGQGPLTEKRQSAGEGQVEAQVLRSQNTINSEEGLSDKTQKKPLVARQLSEAPGTEPGFSIKPPIAQIDEVAAEEAYRKAFGILKEGRYEDSIKAFKTYLVDFPESQYSDNAQYWLGETYYVMRKFLPAIKEYKTLVERFPRSKKHSHAVLKIGYSYYELGMMNESADVLKELIKTFPDSAASRLAEERLARISASIP